MMWDRNGIDTPVELFKVSAFLRGGIQSYGKIAPLPMSIAFNFYISTISFMVIMEW